MDTLPLQLGMDRVRLVNRGGPCIVHEVLTVDDNDTDLNQGRSTKHQSD